MKQPAVFPLSWLVLQTIFSVANIWHLEDVSSVAFPPVGEFVLVFRAGRAPEILRTSDGIVLHKFEEFRVERPNDFAFSPDGRLLAFTTCTGKTGVWGTRDWAQLWSYYREIGQCPKLSFSRDGKVLFSLSQDWRFTVLNSRDGSVVRSFRCPGFPVNDSVSCPVGEWGISAFSGDGQYLAVSAADEVPKVLRLPELASAQTMERPKTQKFWLQYLEFSSNSEYLLAHASVSEAKGTEEEEEEWEEWAWKSASFIWRVRDGKLVSIFPTRVDGFAFSPSARQGVFVRRVGEELLSEAYDDYRVAEVVLWRAKTAKVVKAFLAGVEPLLRGHYLDLGGHYLVSFTKDGSLLAIGGSAFPRGQSSRGGPKIAQEKTSESAVKVWDTFNTRLLAEFRSGREIVDVKLSPDGKYLARLDEDGRLVFWQLAKVK